MFNFERKKIFDGTSWTKKFSPSPLVLITRPNSELRLRHVRGSEFVLMTGVDGGLCER